MGDEMSMHAEALKAHPGRWLWDSPSWNPEHRGDWWVEDANGTKIVASVGNAPWQVARLIARAPRLASEVDRLSADLADALRRAEEVAADNARLVGEAEAMKARVAESQNETLVALGELNRARGERDAPKARAEEAERRNEATVMRNARMHDEIAALKARLAAAEKDRDEWRERTTCGLGALQQQERRHREENDDLRARLAELEAKTAEAEACAAAWKDYALNVRKGEPGTAERDNHRLRELFGRARKERDALKAHAAELEAEAASLRDELTATREARDAWHGQAREAEERPVRWTITTHPDGSVTFGPEALRCS